ncbi:MAG: sugar ABC transporter permease [Chloroflexi bacterium]|nr:sugar ABC transporter permease [Chloroflexota bacterium]
MSTQSNILALERRRAPSLPIVGALRNWSVGKTLVAPAVIYAIIVTQLPFLLTIWYSLQRWNLLRPDNIQFAALDNYLFITPFLIMPVVSALTWKNMMLNPVFGVVDYLMQLVHLPAVDWLAQFPLPAITGIVVWRWAPFMMLILLAGMQSLSDEIREAARVDGVNSIQEFRYIVLPHLNRFIQLGGLLGSVYIVQEFDSIYMTTQGGPGTASTNLPFLIYQIAFAKKDVGEASALGVIVVILTIFAVQYLLRVLSRLTEGD